MASAANVGGSITLTGAQAQQGINQGAAGDLMPRVGITGNFFPTITSSSYGIISIDATTGTAVNGALAATAAQLGNGYMAYGTSNSGTFTGTSLQSDLDNTYRFVLNNYLQLNDSSNSSATGGALEDINGNPCSVDVSAQVTGGAEYVRTENPNGFTGSITVRDNGVFSGWTRNAGSPFGSATGAVNLYGGYLELQNGDANDLSVTKGNVTISGPGGIWVSDSKLTINSILRPDHGVFTVQGEQASGTYLGNGATNGDYLFVTNAPAVTATNGGNGMVAPWMVEYLGRYFLSYSSANGFVPATFTVTGAATGGGTFTSTATDVVNLPSGGTVATGGQSAYAVRLGGDPSTTTTYTLNSNAPGDVLTIVSGGLILASDCGQNYNPAVNTANINFGSGTIRSRA